MKRLLLAVTFVFTVGLALLPAVAWAHHRHHSFHAFVQSGGVSIFIGHGHPLIHHRFFAHPFFVIHPGFVRPRFFVHPTFVHPFSSFVVVHPPVIAIDPPPVDPPAPRRVWVPGFWQWNGFQRVWVPGHWAVPRNPCD